MAFARSERQFVNALDLFASDSDSYYGFEYLCWVIGQLKDLGPAFLAKVE
jgi:hypothetical protein